jgi:C1A family cysteine protease
MRRIVRWRRIGAALMSMAFVFGATLTWEPQVTAYQASAQGKTTGEIVESSVQDVGAPPEVKKKLTEVRKRIQQKKNRFEVGDSSAARRTLPQLAGTVPPIDLNDRISKQRIVSSSRLSARPKVEAARLKVQADPNAPTPTLAKFDWSKRGVVGSVKDQQLCGDCWNFATVGVFESMYAIRNGAGNLLDLSEELLLRCNTESPQATCCGGWWAFDYIRDSGLVGTGNLPYTSGNIDCSSGSLSAPIPACSTVSGRRYQAVAWDYVDGANGVPDAALIKKALCDHGPLICAVTVTDAFQTYKAGIFDEGDNGPINHAVMIVGWTTDGWIVRNSWGSDWGANGYILIAYKSNNIGFGAAWVEVEPVANP